MFFSLRCFRTFLFGLIVILVLPTVPANAQRGSLIEDLFRSISEAQSEREQRNRVNPQAGQPGQPGHDAQRGQHGKLQPVPVPEPAGQRRQSPSINVRSREVAEFAGNLVAMSGSIDPLVNDMQAAAARTPAVRPLLPEAYQVAADTRSLIQRCDGQATFDALVTPYSELDSRWRQLSFQLRAIDGLSNKGTSSVRSCDRLVGQMARQLKIQPQFDRHQLHDLMIIASAHMQTLIDDLQLAQLPQQDSERLSHDVRLMRQRLLGEADRSEEAAYEDVVTRFTDFVSKWSQVSESLYALNNPYLQRRLDRIRECGDQTYALLWMPPPYNAGSLTASAHRLEQSCSEVLDQLTLRSLVNLPPRDQLRVMEQGRRMYQDSRELEKLTTSGSSRAVLQTTFNRIDQDWSFLRNAYAKVPRINQATLASIEHECGHIRDALGLRGSGSGTISYEDLIQVAAALEGASEYLHADVHRYERYLQPAYRNSIVNASEDFYQHAKSLHSLLSNRTDLATLQQETEHLLDAWQQLSRDVATLESHGLSSQRAASLKRDVEEITPQVARMAAALIK